MVNRPVEPLGIQDLLLTFRQLIAFSLGRLGWMEGDGGVVRKVTRKHRVSNILLHEAMVYRDPGEHNRYKAVSLAGGGKVRRGRNSVNYS